MPPEEKTYHVDFDGLIEHVNDVCSPDAAKKLIYEIKRRELKYKIKADYERRKNETDKAREEIIAEMAEEYFGDSDSFFHRTNNAISQNDDAYFNNPYG